VNIEDTDFIELVSKDLGRKIIHVHVEHGSTMEPEVEVNELPIPSVLASSLARRGISKLYRYQYEAFKKIKEGNDVVIISGTGTGKTEAFLLPVLSELLNCEDKLCIILYPTKALARDQYERIKIYVNDLGIDVEVYDGDTPEHVRRRIYEKPPSILITNPDMLHFALMYVSKFKEIVSHVGYVVLDDFHMYSGVLGVHVHYILRRLRRFCKNTQYISTSASIGNPEEFARQILNRSVLVIQGVTERKGRVIHLMIKPQRRSKIIEASELTRIFLEHDKKCLVFADSHRVVELIKKVLDNYGFESIVMVHRAGLRPEDRRRIEHDFKTGKLKALITTPTLEVGIDIGDVDIAIMATVPPSYIKYVQRSGRVGRKGQTSYVIQIIGNDPISSYYEKHPEEFYNRKPEPLYVEPMNRDIASAHILAMIRDRPVRIDELNNFEYSIIKELEHAQLVYKKGRYYILTDLGKKYVNSIKSIRGIGDMVKIVSGRDRVIGSRELPIAIKELHKGAIYLHGGEVYEVVNLDMNRRIAYVKKLPKHYKHITTALYEVKPIINQVINTDSHKAYVELKIRETVYGYVVRDYLSSETIQEVELEEPVSYEFVTKGIILKFPEITFSSIDIVDFLERAKAYHAVEHALIIASNIVIGSGMTDLGGVSYPTGHVVIYDTYPGGSGLSKLLLSRIGKALEIAYKLVKDCTCIDGCPKCIYSPYCGNNNKFLSRRNAIKVFEYTLRGIDKYFSEDLLELPNVQSYT